MEEQNDSAMPAGIIGGATAAKQTSYLTQMAKEAMVCRDLLNVLRVKLDTISDRTPSEPTDKAISGEAPAHASTLVSVMRENNRTLDKLIQEAAI